MKRAAELLSLGESRGRVEGGEEDLQAIAKTTWVMCFNM